MKQLISTFTRVSGLRRFRKLFQQRALVLMYHRIAATPVDPWQLSVSPTHFAEHLKVLKSSFHVISAAEMVEKAKRNKLKDRSVCITFDDGYRDNSEIAKPLLERFACPATFFIATHFTGLEQAFWWDELAGIFLETNQLPAILKVGINHESIEVELAGNGKLLPGELQQHRNWFWPEPAPTQRCELYLSIWEKLRPLPFQEIEMVMIRLRAWAAYQSDPGVYPMTAQQLAALYKHELIDIGVHTHTHPALAFHGKELQRDEITRSKSLLEDGVRSMKLMAYPYGNHNEATVEIVRELGLAGAFTTAETTITGNADSFRLGRFQVKNWNGSDFSYYMKKWLS